VTADQIISLYEIPLVCAEFHGSQLYVITKVIVL